MESNLNLCCSVCFNHLIPSVDALCFYEKDITTCHLVLKPEFLQLASPLKNNTIQAISECNFIKEKSNIIVFEETTTKKKQAYKLYCKFCGVVSGKHIGSLVTIGPNNEGLFCFSFAAEGKVGSILSPCTPKSFKWKQTRAYINNLIDKRKESNFEVTNVLKAPNNTSEIRLKLSKSYLRIKEMKLAIITPRDYQIESFSHSIVNNSIVCLPTGTGKTLVAFMFMRFFSYQNPSKLAVFLAPKIALIQQQYAKFLDEIINPSTKAFYMTSESTYDEREGFLNEFKEYVEKKDYSKNYFVFLTPQYFYNLIAGKELFFHNCCAIVFDEAHHTSKNNAYMKIMELYSQIQDENFKPALLGLTASLAGEEDFDKTILRIKEISSNLKSRPFIPIVFTKELEETKNSINILTHSFEMNDTEMYLKVAIESFITNYAKNVLQIKNLILSKKNTFFCQLGNIDSAIRRSNESLIALLKKMMNVLDCNKRLGSSKSIDMLKALISSETDTKIDLKSHFSYFFDVEKEISSNVITLCQILKDNFKKEDQYDSRALIFVKERYTAKWLSEQLANDQFLSKFVPSYCVGQNGVLGMSWQDQNRPIIKKFEIGLVKILVATNVLEEGIDITACNLVIRFEGKMSLRSFIQSQGRARQMKSTFIIISHKTEDELKSLERKQENMEKAMKHSMVEPTQEEINQINRITEMVKENQLERKEKHESKEQVGNEERKVFHSLPNGEFLIEALIFGKKEANPKIVISQIFQSFASIKQLSDQSTNLAHMVVCDKEQFQDRINLTNFYFPFLSKSEGFTYNESSIWINWKEESKSTENQEDSVKKLNIGIAHGFFVSRELFYQSDDYVSKAVLSYRKNYFLLEIGSFTFKLNYPWLFKVGLETIEKNGDMLSLYLTTIILPFAFDFFEDGQSTKENRITDEEIEKWTKFFSFRLIFKLGVSSDMHRDFYLKFRASLIKNGVTLYGTRINNKLMERKSSNEDKNVFESNLDIYFEYQCLKTQYAHFLGPEFPAGASYSLLKQVFGRYDHADIVRIFGLLKKLIISPFENFEELLTKAIEQHEQAIEQHEQKRNLLKSIQIKEKTNEMIHSIIKIVITPGRTIFQDRIPVFSNRILREFRETNKFVIVQFSDEDYNRFPNCDYPIRKLQHVFRNGLLIDGRLYRFLSSSNAQIKNMSVWFTNYDPLVIINWIGDFSKFKNVGKMISRIGLSLGSNIPTIKIKDEVLDSNRILEDKIDSNGNIFTDGIGIISHNAAKQIFEMLKIGKYFITNSNLVHSALQIRLAGCKGVLSISPLLDEKLDHDSKNEEVIGFDQIKIRKSMYKFDSPHRTIEVNNVSAPIPCHLNRQIIMLLSNLGIEDEIFMGMLLNDLKIMGQMFRELNIAKRELITLASPSILIRKPFISMTQSVSEPFIKSLLIAIYNKKTFKLRKKSNISVPEGRLMMGVIDETDSLDYGEVYFNYSEKDFDSPSQEESYNIKNVVGYVVVIKNPCLHPGDVRILNAKPTKSVSQYLHHFTDCLVFPAKGKRPHTNEISGSDLDGDLYSVIWDKNLVPSVDKMKKAASYESQEENKKPEGKINIDDMIEFLVTYYKEISLGRIANFHLAQSDLNGVNDSKCLRLAQLHSEAVDYIKTGKPPVIDDDLIPQEYPDFMEKQEFEKTYESEKILGTIYRKSKFLNKLKIKGGNVDNTLINSANNFNQNMKEKHLKETEMAYFFYTQGMNNIQETFGIESEGEIVTGEIISFHAHLKNGDTFKLTELARAKFQELITQTIKQYFLEGVFEDLNAALLSNEREYFIEKAKFWYDYVYHINNEADFYGVVKKCYSFP